MSSHSSARTSGDSSGSSDPHTHTHTHTHQHARGMANGSGSPLPAPPPTLEDADADGRYYAASSSGDADSVCPPDDDETAALRRYSRELVQYMLVKYREAKEGEKRAEEEKRQSTDLGAGRNEPGKTRSREGRK